MDLLPNRLAPLPSHGGDEGAPKEQGEDRQDGEGERPLLSLPEPAHKNQTGRLDRTGDTDTFHSYYVAPIVGRADAARRLQPSGSSPLCLWVSLETVLFGPTRPDIQKLLDTDAKWFLPVRSMMRAGFLEAVSRAIGGASPCEPMILQAVESPEEARNKAVFKLKRDVLLANTVPLMLLLAITLFVLDRPIPRWGPTGKASR